jgi:LuxR family maltose regulon positive regulatory protein
MAAPILATKLYAPPPLARMVLRTRLVDRLNEGITPGQGAGRRLTLISAPAGFGKTTLVSEWVAGCQRRVAWLSLDKGDNELTRFLTYFVAALRGILPGAGAGMAAALQSPQPPPAEILLTDLINEIAAAPEAFVLVLDDYHEIDARPVEQALDYLLEHLPPQMHLVIATREDPSLPLARLRARGQLAELRAADLRFTPAEAAEFLNRAMGLALSAQDIDALETRTEGWIAGLQLAAISMQGNPDPASFIQSFTGSHHFVLDYLLEEVLQRQPAAIQTFLLRTSILERLCGPLCEAVTGAPAAAGQETLEYLERANLFIVPLDRERRWYRYHHLFADLLRQRLKQNLPPETITGDHVRASQWYEDNGLAFEAFGHATAAGDIERAGRLIESNEMPSHFRGVGMAILDWLASLPAAALDAHPALWVKSATLALVAGLTSGVEERLQSAEKALQGAVLDDRNRDLLGQIASARATLALTRYQPETMIAQSGRALEYLRPDNLVFRFTASWVQATAYFLLGDRAAAARACQEGIAISQKSGDAFSTILATANLAQLQELENQLPLAAETYRSVLPMFGDHPQPNAAEVHLGLARICYEWNDLEAAEEHGQQSLRLARLYDRVIDRFIISEVFLARLKLARGDAGGAAALLEEAGQSARRQNFLLRLPEIAAVQVQALLRQGDLPAAAHLAHQSDLPLSRARVLLAQGDPGAALAALEPLRRQMEAKNWADERLRVLALQAVALHLGGDASQAGQVLSEALALAEPGGFIRLFVDEGAPMAELLCAAAGQGAATGYVRRLLAAFQDEASKAERSPTPAAGAVSLAEPLSPRELEVLRLVAQGLSNQEIGRRLFLALDTVKGHNRRIFEKLQVQRRTEAIARARELGLL